MKKSTIIITLIIVAAAGVYLYYEGNPLPQSSSTLDATSGAATVGTQVLNLLNQIRSLKIDDSLFTDPGYRTLRDYSVSIPPENVGRANPFAPIPGSAVPAGAH